MSIHVAIVEDDARVRENLAVLIDAAPGFACVAACGSAEEATIAILRQPPDVVLMDIHLPVKSGIECVRELKPRLPKTQFIMLTIEENSERVFEALQAGATGYLVKNVPTDAILAAIADVKRGGSPISSHIARMLVQSFQVPATKAPADARLTERESEILRLLARGYRSKEVAEELRISVPTVNTHVRNVYEKLHVRSRAEAVAHLLSQRP